MREPSWVRLLNKKTSSIVQGFDKAKQWLQQGLQMKLEGNTILSVLDTAWNASRSAYKRAKEHL